MKVQGVVRVVQVVGGDSVANALLLVCCVDVLLVETMSDVFRQCSCNA